MSKMHLAVCYNCKWRRDCMSSICSKCVHPNLKIAYPKPTVRIVLKKGNDDSPFKKHPRVSKFDPWFIKSCSGFTKEVL